MLEVRFVLKLLDHNILHLYRWASSSGGGPSMPVRGSSSSSTLGGLGMMDFLRGNVSHPPQSSLSSMSMAMMSQNDRFQTSNFRKY